MRFFRFSVVVAAVAAVMAAAVSSPASAQAREKCVIAWSHYTGWEPWGYMDASGILKKWADKEHIKIELTLVNDYVRTGKVRYIFREFPLDTLAAAAFMLARCAGEKDSSKYFAMVDTLFSQQPVASSTPPRKYSRGRISICQRKSFSSVVQLAPRLERVGAVKSMRL